MNMNVTEKTIFNLEYAQRVSGSETAVLVCPPLTQARFEKDRQNGSSLNIFGKKKEFVKKNLAFLPNWETYNEKVALPALVHLSDIKQKCYGQVGFDVTFSDFKKIYLNANWKVLFLVAHHINGKHKKKRYIEFSDGGCPIDVFSKFIRKNSNPKSPSLILLICKSNLIGDRLRTDSPLLQSIGAAYGFYPFVKGIQFLSCWIQQMDGTCTLGDTYRRAIAEFWSF